uniref:Amino acid permease/ SLC12A domain-containing protein n=1 Tax=Knipowitschia caucasica TaxID=637954 RepID=A0AAV2JGD8_KNICA
MDGKAETLALKREVGLVGAVSLIAGTMIGSGIFMSPQTVLFTIGSPGASLVVWASCGVLVILAAFCYSELGTVIKESGGEYIYILRTSGPVMAFMLIFSSVLFVRPAGVAGISLSFAQYAVAPFYPECPPPSLLVKAVAAVSILVLATVNCLNVRFSMSVQVFFMVAKVLALAVIIVGGVVMLINGHTENFENSFENTNVGINPIGIAFYQGLWSYDGWNNLNYVTEELKRPEMAPEKHMLSLQREIGLLGAVSFIAGTMIGSGIFISPLYVLSAIGSPAASLIIWAGCGALALLGGLCYAELGTVIPESGGEYVYMLQTTGRVSAFVFVFSFVNVLRPASATGIALSVAEYVVAPFYTDCPPPQQLLKCVAAVSILAVALVNCASVRAATLIQVLCTAVKLLALSVIAGLYSYDGWNTLNLLTEELKYPEVNLPRAIIIAISLVTGLYLLVNVSYLTVMTPKELMMSNAVAVTWGNKVLGSWGWIMSVAAALSAFGSLNGTFFSGGRVCFVAAREGHMPDILSMAHVHRLTPSPALIFTTFVSLLVLIPGDFQSIVNYFSFTAWFFYAITMIGLLYLKIKRPDLPRPYKVPIVLPVTVLIAAVFLVLAPIIDSPQIEYLYVALFIFSGVIVYVPFIHYKMCPGLLTKLTQFLQLLLEVAPAEKNV